MKYIANPVEVNAFVIENVADSTSADGSRQVWLAEHDGPELVTPEMTSRMAPKAGDYYVVQSDGYVYKYRIVG